MANKPSTGNMGPYSPFTYRNSDRGTFSSSSAGSLSPTLGIGAPRFTIGSSGRFQTSTVTEPPSFGFTMPGPIVNAPPQQQCGHSSTSTLAEHPTHGIINYSPPSTRVSFRNPNAPHAQAPTMINSGNSAPAATGSSFFSFRDPNHPKSKANLSGVTMSPAPPPPAIGYSRFTYRNPGQAPQRFTATAPVEPQRMGSGDLASATFRNPNAPPVPHSKFEGHAHSKNVPDFSSPTSVGNQQQTAFSFDNSSQRSGFGSHAQAQNSNVMSFENSGRTAASSNSNTGNGNPAQAQIASNFRPTAPVSAFPGSSQPNIQKFWSEASPQNTTSWPYTSRGPESNFSAFGQNPSPQIGQQRNDSGYGDTAFSTFESQSQSQPMKSPMTMAESGNMNVNPPMATSTSRSSNFDEFTTGQQKFNAQSARDTFSRDSVPTAQFGGQQMTNANSDPKRAGFRFGPSPVAQNSPQPPAAQAQTTFSMNTNNNPGFNFGQPQPAAAATATTPSPIPKTESRFPNLPQQKQNYFASTIPLDSGFGNNQSTAIPRQAAPLDFGRKLQLQQPPEPQPLQSLCAGCDGPNPNPNRNVPTNPYSNNERGLHQFGQTIQPSQGGYFNYDTTGKNYAPEPRANSMFRGAGESKTTQ